MSTTKYEIRVYLTDEINRFQRYAVGEGNAKMSFDTEAEARNAYGILQKIRGTNRSLTDLAPMNGGQRDLKRKCGMISTVCSTTSSSMSVTRRFTRSCHSTKSPSET